MKKEIIIFKDQKPTKEEICHSIEHFCMDHSIDCICVTRRDRILYKIDGELYQTKIQEDHLDHPKFSSFLYNTSIFRNGTGCSGYGFNCFSYQLTSRHLPFL